MSDIENWPADVKNTDDLKRAKTTIRMALKDNQ
jgi:hypothetical protein